MTGAERIAERRRNVAVLNKQGRSVRAIALQLGVGRTTVHRDLKALESEAGGMPANLRTWPPAEPGNERAMTHGLDSPRVIGQLEQRARELAPSIVANHGHLDDARDALAVLRYAMDLARLERAWAWLAQQPDDLFLDAKVGDVHALHGRMAGWEASAARAEERLAISPRERTRLKLEHRQLLNSGLGDRRDYGNLTDDELTDLRRLHAKAAGTLDAEAVAA